MGGLQHDIYVHGTYVFRGSFEHDVYVGVGGSDEAYRMILAEWLWDIVSGANITFCVSERCGIVFITDGS